MKKGIKITSAIMANVIKLALKKIYLVLKHGYGVFF